MNYSNYCKNRKERYFQINCNNTDSDEIDNIGYVNPYVLRLIKDAIASEKEGAAHYAALAEKYPEYKEYFTAMAADEKKHNKMLSALYEKLSGKIPVGVDVSVQNTDTEFETDLKNALDDELSDAKLYRTLYFAMPTPAYKNVLFEIMTDELMHADMLGMME